MEAGNRQERVRLNIERQQHPRACHQEPADADHDPGAARNIERDHPRVGLP